MSPSKNVYTHNYAGYSRGCRCDICTESKREYQRSQRQYNAYVRNVYREVTGREYIDASITHGIGGYDNFKCRCDICVAAKAAKDKRRQERKKAERD